MRRYGIPFIVIVVVTLCGCSRHRAGDEDEEGPSPHPVVSVHTGMITRGEIPVLLTATGRTDVLKKEKILSPIAGKIIALKVKEFQHVHEGDILAVIRPGESQAALDGARSLLQSAKTPQQKSDAEKSLEIASRLESNAILRSAFTGIVTSRSVTEGELVSENSELFVLIDPSTLYCIADLPLRDVGQVRDGQKCFIRSPAFHEKVFSGTVEAVSPQSDLQSQTVGVRIGLRRQSSAIEQLLRPNMAVTVTIVCGLHHAALLVPKSALIRNDETGEYTCVSVTSDSLAKMIAVRVVAQSDSMAEVAGDGVREGMMIVTEGNYGLADSTKVSIVRQHE